MSNECYQIYSVQPNNAPFKLLEDTFIPNITKVGDTIYLNIAEGFYFVVKGIAKRCDGSQTDPYVSLTLEISQ